MKRIICGIFLTLGMTMESFAKDFDFICGDFGALSSLVMEARQEGVDKNDFMQYLMTKFSEDTFENHMLLRYSKDMMDIAYEIPVAKSKDSKSKVVTTFTADMNKLCSNNMEKLFKIK
ncbi:hypothetical protein [Acinetobacter rudis]|uniref:Uncharacterized protein n=1 Tax=Acinetobacter rudis CIP 110305 TaxID=421052 RepID=S3N8F4_9GAMM|nr:hypothetical protein [Acinetobacter rudis]EPF74653.1 hypothetical protein F945_01420 [Acinetobacter rudis CIP 110305]